MKIKPTILNIAGVIQIIYSIIYYFLHGRQGDQEGWRVLATIVLGAFGIRCNTFGSLFENNI
jgi:heme/copper-type cytochrome/quinol oxidase subunit 4